MGDHLVVGAEESVEFPRQQRPAPSRHVVALGSLDRTSEPSANCKRLNFLKKLDHGSEQGLKMSADTFGPGPKRRFEHPDPTRAFAEFPAAAGNARYAGRCEAADADLRGIGIALYGASAIITVASVTWLALSFS